MKSILGFLCIGVIGFFALPFLPWWGIVGIAALIGFLVHARGGNSFWYGFFAVFLLWGGMAYWLDMNNNSLLGNRMGALFGGLPSLAIITLTALLGGLLGGMSSLTGSLGREWVTPNNIKQEDIKS